MSHQSLKMSAFVMMIFALCGLTAVCCNSINSIETNINYLDVVIRRLHKPAGKAARFRCHLPETHANFKVHWRFKKCGAYNENSCESHVNEISMADYDFIENEDVNNISSIWTTLQCKQSCKMMEIHHLTGNNSGIYQCYVRQNESQEFFKNIQIIKTYELVVVDTPEPSFPEIIDDFPKYVVTNVFDQVVFQCKVHSNHAATILWLKHLDANGNMSLHDTSSYEALKSSGEIQLSHSLYLSKLIIPRPTLKDGGVYECVAVNNIGYTHKSVRLDVVDTSDLATDHGSPLYSLFLIPTTFLFLPLSIWLCYLYKKMQRAKKEQKVRESHSTCDTWLI